jgi:hypothetical protein
LAEAAAPLGSERLHLSALAHLVVVVLPLVPAELADLVQEARLPALARLVLVVLPLALAELAVLVQEARLPALAPLVVEAQLLQLLRNQSFSASTARNSL